MELADYLRVLRRRWWLIVLAVVVCVGAAGASSWSRTPVYTATTRISVVAGGNDNAVLAIANRQQANTNAMAYAQYVSTGPGLAAAVAQANAQGSGAQVTAGADGNNPFITITVTANSPHAAQAVANAYVLVLPKVITILEQTAPASAPKLSTLEAAPLPRKPTSPNHPRDLVVGLVIGLALGVAGALVRETLDARVRDSAEIEKITGATLLGSIPRENSGDLLVSMTRPRSGRAEAYRHVRTNLEFTGPRGMPTSIVITSAAPGEGKSSLSVNLAIVAARSGRRVVLVDADLRKPSVAKYFDVKSAVGLSDVLAGRWTWQEALVPVEGEGVQILTSGPIPRFPSELVGSQAMATLISELEAEFDFVIVDTPPVLPVSDALVIGVNVDGVIVVGRMVETRRAALKRAVEAVRKVDANLLGVVGNAVVKLEEKAYGEGYGYAYGYISNAPQENLPQESIAPAGRREQSGRRAARHSQPLLSDEVPLQQQSPLQPQQSVYPQAGHWGYQQPGYPPAPAGYSPGYPPPAQLQAGYPQAGYPQAGYPQAGYPQAGYQHGEGPVGNGYGQVAQPVAESAPWTGHSRDTAQRPQRRNDPLPDRLDDLIFDTDG